MASGGSVRGVFNYLGPMIERPLFYTEFPERGNLNLEPHDLPVNDMRKAVSTPTLDKEGFMLSRLPFQAGADIGVSAIAESYAPLVMQFFRDLTSAPKIVLTPPLLRWSDRIPHPESVNSLPARYVHCDYSRAGFHQIMHAMVANDPEKDRWLSGHYAAFNSWRVLSPPPQDMPLALVDRSTLSPDDLIPGTVIIEDGQNTMQFEQGMIRHNPAHRWAYASNMTADDMLVFVGFDNADDRLSGNPHSAFDDASSGDDAVPRVSCEVRAMVYWGE